MAGVGFIAFGFLALWAFFVGVPEVGLLLLVLAGISFAYMGEFARYAIGSLIALAVLAGLG